MPGYYVKNRRIPSSDSGVVLPTGTTAARPTAPVPGLIRYNTDIALIEFFDGTQYTTLDTGAGLDYVVDTFTGDGSTTVFTMSLEVSDPNQILVYIGGVYQGPSGTPYTVDGGYDITFSEAPPGDEPINVIHST